MQASIQCIAGVAGDGFRSDSRPTAAQIHEQRPGNNQEHASDRRPNQIANDGVGESKPSVRRKQDRMAHAQIAIGDHVQGVAGHHRRPEHESVGNAYRPDGADIPQPLANGEAPEIVRLACLVFCAFHVQYSANDAAVWRRPATSVWLLSEFGTVWQKRLRQRRLASARAVPTVSPRSNRPTWPLATRQLQDELRLQPKG